MKICAGEDSHDDMCLISKYCDYIESGGTVQYTNFKFEGITLYKNETVLRFFTLCGNYVNRLTINATDNYWFCDHPDGLCKQCLDQEVIYFVMHRITVIKVNNF